MSNSGVSASQNSEPLVIKVGGSLFDLPDLDRRINNLVRRAGRRALLVPGGGPAADIVRGWQKTHLLSDPTAHQLALTSLRMGTALLTQLLTDGVSAGSRDAVGEAWSADRVPILDVGRFLQEEEQKHSIALRHDWTVTSDAIAAWVARIWPARRLLLLKSVARPKDQSWPEMAAAGLVDGAFSVLASGLQVRWLNLRTNDPESSADVV